MKKMDFLPPTIPIHIVLIFTHRDELRSTSVFNTMVEGVIGHVGITDIETCLNIWNTA